MRAHAPSIILSLAACTSPAAGEGPDESLDVAVVAVETNIDHSCAISEHGQLRCWGRGQWGLLAGGERPECGVAFDDSLPASCTIGDDEVPSEGPPLDLGGPVRAVALGVEHACALLDDGTVRCWGHDFRGALLGLAGLGDGVIGDDESPASLPPVDIGASVVELVAGSVHTCARTDEGGVRCWGSDDSLGMLGYGMAEDVGDDETPASYGDVPIGGPVRALASRDYRTCAVLEDGHLRCWGQANPGLLGYGELSLVNWTPEEAGDVPLDVEVVSVALSSQASCVLDSVGSVWCWGEERYLGAGHDSFEQLTSDQAVEVPVGAEVEALVGGFTGFCVLTIAGGVRCWGELHGYPGGASELPGSSDEVASFGDLELGATARSVNVGSWRGGCVTTDAGGARCWGRAPFHGYPGFEALGDDEAPGAAGDLELF